MAMRKYLLATLTLLAALICSAAEPSADLLKFDVLEHNFGIINETDKPVEVEYAFENVSDEPVAVLSVSAACGCTVPEYPVKPLRPGEKGIIKVTFTPDGQAGEVNKDIKVRFQRAKARASKSLTLRLKGAVKPK